MSWEPPYFGIGSLSPLILHPHCAFLPLGFLHVVYLYSKMYSIYISICWNFPCLSDYPKEHLFHEDFLTIWTIYSFSQGSLSLFPPFFTLSFFMISWSFIISPARSKLYGRQGFHSSISCSSSHGFLKIFKIICQTEFSRQSITIQLLCFCEIKVSKWVKSFSF